MAIVEGIGDEVLLVFALLALLIVILVAWTSTRVRPLFNNGSVWMVHMQTAPERRVLEVYSLDERSTATQQLTSGALSIEEISSSSPPVVDVDLAPTSSTSEESDDNSENQHNQSDNDLQHDTSKSNPTLRKRLTTNTTDGNSAHDSHNSDVSSKVHDNNKGKSGQVESRDDSGTSTNDTTTIKLKFLDDTQRLVAAWLTQTVGDFKKQHFENDVSQGKVIRLIYQGQLLRDDSRSLASYGLHENCVLHCHVSTTPYEQPNAGRRVSGRGAAVQPPGAATAQGVFDNAGNGLDLGRHIYVVFAFKFAILWSAWFVFPEYFSRTSLVSLILCSGLFMLFWYGSQRRRPVVENRTDNIRSN